MDKLPYLRCVMGWTLATTKVIGAFPTKGWCAQWVPSCGRTSPLRAQKSSREWASGRYSQTPALSSGPPVTVPLPMQTKILRGYKAPADGVVRCRTRAIKI